MTSEGTVEKVKRRQGIFARIQNIITGGYGTKEDLRELDRKLRDFYYSDFTAMRHRWEEIYLSALNAGQLTSSDDLKKITQVLDRVAEKVNRADYGYAGLWDRKGHIREDEIARVFDLDKGLGEDIQKIADAIEELHSCSEAAEWKDLSTRVKNVKSLILTFESKWNDRKKRFRPLEL